MRQLPDAFKDFTKKKFGKGKFTGAFMTHCHRELFHAQWEVLLDDEFLEAYAHGIVIICPDGVERRFYPRIFSYSADYPEKYVIFTVSDAVCSREEFPVGYFLPASGILVAALALDA